MDSGQAIAAACLSSLGPPNTWRAPPGYEGLAEATIDAIWSMGVRYGSVDIVLNRYRAWVLYEHAVSSARRTASQLQADICSVGGADQFAEVVVANRQRTSTTNGVLKAEATFQATEVFVLNAIDTAEDLAEHASDEVLKASWLAIDGQRSGISWRYVLMNVRVDNVKPDRMICRFVARALGVGSMSAAGAHDEVRAAHSLLIDQEPSLTLRGLDHAIWRFESGRS